MNLSEHKNSRTITSIVTTNGWWQSGSKSTFYSEVKSIEGNFFAFETSGWLQWLAAVIKWNYLSLELESSHATKRCIKTIWYCLTQVSRWKVAYRTISLFFNSKHLSCTISIILWQKTVMQFTLLTIKITYNFIEGYPLIPKSLAIPKKKGRW